MALHRWKFHFQLSFLFFCKFQRVRTKCMSKERTLHACPHAHTAKQPQFWAPNRSPWVITKIALGRHVALLQLCQCLYGITWMWLISNENESWRTNLPPTVITAWHHRFYSLQHLYNECLYNEMTCIMKDWLPSWLNCCLSYVLWMPLQRRPLRRICLYIGGI